MTELPPSDHEELINDLKSALAHLDDPVYLEGHALVWRIDVIAQSPEISRGQLLRKALRLAIEALDPGIEVPINAPEARAYQILHRHAIAKESMIAVASKLDISERQAYRELRRAVEALAQILIHFDAEASLLPADEATLSRAAKVRQELERLEIVRYQPVALNSLVANVVRDAHPLALERGIAVELCDDAPDVIVTTNRVMLRQALLNLLSYAITTQQEGHLSVRMARVGDSVRIQCEYRPENRIALADPTSPYRVALQLLDSLGIRHTSENTSDGAMLFSVYLRLAHERKVLVIDDNSGIISLFRSYLRRQPYRVYGAGTATEALQMVREIGPDIIILDVMMPDRDGWEILRVLRQSEAGARAKVVVCSIINDPQLAAALGADGFLHKPVDQAGLLQALGQALMSGL
jgi:CheY-like chemotaxis protein